MKKAALYLGILTISIFFCSCDSERDNTGYTGPAPETTFPALKLSKMTEHTYVGSDTLTTVTNFTYDHNGYLTGTDNGSVHNEIAYLGTKKITSVTSSDGSGTTTTQFNYAGDKLTSVFGHGAQETKVVYTYKDNRILSKDYFQLENNGFVRKKNTVFASIGNNSNEEQTEVYQATDTLSTKMELVFDQTINPFNFLNQYLKLAPFFEDNLPYDFNNRASTTLTDLNDPAATPEKFTYSVTVDSNNYATSIKKVNADGVTVKEWLFEYLETAAQ